MYFVLSWWPHFDNMYSLLWSCWCLAWKSQSFRDPSATVVASAEWIVSWNLHIFISSDYRWQIKTSITAITIIIIRRRRICRPLDVCFNSWRTWWRLLFVSLLVLNTASVMMSCWEPRLSYSRCCWWIWSLVQLSSRTLADRCLLMDIAGRHITTTTWLVSQQQQY